MEEAQFPWKYRIVSMEISNGFHRMVSMEIQNGFYGKCRTVSMDDRYGFQDKFRNHQRRQYRAVDLLKPYSLSSTDKVTSNTSNAHMTRDPADTVEKHV